MLSQYFDIDITDQIIDICKDSSEEQCGFIIKDNDTQILVHAENVATNKATSFTIDEETYLDNADKNVVAVWHSHTSDEQAGELSEADVRQSKAHSLPYLLYHTKFKTWDYFDPANVCDPFPLSPDWAVGNDKSVDRYEGWRWVYNRSDCYSLFRAYYKGIYDIELQDYPRPLNKKHVLTADWNSYEDNMESAGFIRQNRRPMKGDAVLLNVRGRNAHHIGQMVTDDDMLHLLDETELSKIVMFAQWELYLSSVWRHRNIP